MSNIKKICISGEIPFDAPNKSLTIATALAWCSMPHFGLKSEFTDAYFMPNEHGGMTEMFKFKISGEEAVGFAWFELLVKEIKRIGRVTHTKIIDLEA